MASRRFRLRFTFWLDVNKPDENDLAGQIEQLKGRRSFTRTVRDGIRLMCDLRNHKLDVLLELFPWVGDYLVHLQGGSETIGYLGLQEQLTRLEQHLLQGGAVPVVRSLPPIPTVSLDEDDNQDLITVTQAKAGDSAQNFLNSLAALNS